MDINNASGEELEGNEEHVNRNRRDRDQFHIVSEHFRKWSCKLNLLSDDHGIYLIVPKKMLRVLPGVLVCSGWCNKISQMAWPKPQKFISHSSRSWDV